MLQGVGVQAIVTEFLIQYTDLIFGEAIVVRSPLPVCRMPITIGNRRTTGDVDMIAEIIAFMKTLGE